MILKFIKIALTSFPEVGHDGAKEFTAEICCDFLDNRLELRDCSGLLPEDLGICVPPEVAVINPDCKGILRLALKSPVHECLPPRMPDFWCSGVRRCPVVTTTNATQPSLDLPASLRSILL